MLTITKEIPAATNYSLERIGAPESILFFDIETTGFSGDYSRLYLIGCCYFKSGKWFFTQWFADKKNEEANLLKAFFAFMNDYRILLHFNGDRFDIPFLLKRCAHLKLSYNFQNIHSFDIYKKIKPFKNLLKLENVKQKTIEEFLGIFRKDMFSGGDLIPIYEEYLYTQEKQLEKFLLLHNEDDLKGMPSILSILNYSDFIAGDFYYESHQVSPSDHIGTEILTLFCSSEIALPSSICYNTDLWQITASNHQLVIAMPLFSGECKYFHPDYKNYYYLPLEDSAIHKSLAEFVDREHKIKATAKTCYTRLKSLFLPEKELIFTPALKQSYSDKHYYVSYQPELFDDPIALNRYIKHIWASIKP